MIVMVVGLISIVGWIAFIFYPSNGYGRFDDARQWMRELLLNAWEAQWSLIRRRR